MALVDRDGVTVSHIGAIAEEEAMPLAAYVMHRLKSADLTSRLFAGEVLTLAMEDRVVAVGVTRRQLFVVAVLGDWTSASQAIVRGGSTSGPAELPLIEIRYHRPPREGVAGWPSTRTIHRIGYRADMPSDAFNRYWMERRLAGDDPR